MESGLEQGMDLTSSSYLQSTPIRGHQDEIPDMSESLMLESPVERQKVTQPASIRKDNDKVNMSSGEPSVSLSDSLSMTRKALSDITEFLTIPAVASKKSKGKSKNPAGARVLTSEDSLTLLPEKEKKKREEEEAKQQRKLEREEKRMAREAEKKKKEEEKEQKLLERKNKVAELEEKHNQREQKRKERENKSSASSRTAESSRVERGLQSRESSTNEETMMMT